jgi:hypothetical protein
LSGQLVAQEQELFALGHHALVDLQDHGQQRGDEQRLALTTLLVAEIVGTRSTLIGGTASPWRTSVRV